MSTMRTELTLYYDGKCPFCSAEMRRLAGWDRANRLDFVDIGNLQASCRLNAVSKLLF